MIVHRLNHESTRIETTEQDESALAEVLIGQDKRTLLSMLMAGEAVFVAGYWLFPSLVYVASGELVPVSNLSVQAGLAARSGEPGSCDAHWIEFKQIVKRGVSIDLSGIEVNMAAMAGNLH